MIERLVVMFLAWIGVGAVVAEAWRGRLPSEMSSHGFRYADADSAEEAIRRVEATLSSHEAKMRRIEKHLGRIEGRLARGEAGSIQ